MKPPSPTLSQFQRVFSKPDEILLLKTLFELHEEVDSSHSSPSRSGNNRVNLKRIKEALGLKYSLKQLDHKIQKLKSKYTRQLKEKAVLRNRHQRRRFRLSDKIWRLSVTAEHVDGEFEEEEKGMDGGEDEENMQGEAEEEDGHNMQGEEKENEVVEGAEANRGGEEPYLEEGSKGKEDVVFKKYPSLINEFSRYFPHSFVWQEGFQYLGDEKLKEMNLKWCVLRVEEAKIMRKKLEFLHQQSNLLVEVFNSLSNKK